MVFENRHHILKVSEWRMSLEEALTYLLEKIGLKVRVCWSTSFSSLSFELARDDPNTLPSIKQEQFIRS